MITVRALQKRFTTESGESFRALDHVSFHIAPGTFYVLLGPSGSGKTTTLRCIAGLEQPDSGDIEIDGIPVFEGAERVPAERRPIGMVFQSYALWPHMDVSRNILFPLHYGFRRVSRPEAQRRLDTVLAILQLEHLANRPVTKLSGGQQQRVALARALALEPKVLLMDEPLSNLDAKLRTDVRSELKQLTVRLGITTLYVTHDQMEAVMLGDVVSVMNEGRILQESSPWELYRRPQDVFVAQFIGDMNLIAGRLRRVDGDSCLIDTPLGELRAVCPPHFAAGRKVALVIGFADVRPAADGGPNRAEARVINRQFSGDCFLYDVEAAGVPMRVKLPVDQQIETGQTIWIELPDTRAFVCALPESHKPTTAS